jgi:hypothetical protein
MFFTKKIAALMGLALAMAIGSAQAATPSVANTTWSLSGKFSGTAKVKCQVGGSHAVPINGKKNLSASIQFDDGDVLDDNEGAFTLTDSFFSTTEVTGQWTQTGAKLTLELDNWYDSPMAVLAFALAQVPSDFDFSQADVSGSTGPLKVTKLTISGTINKTGKTIQIKEGMGFKFDASASAYGSYNACSYNFSNLGRSYTGKLAQ